MPRLKKTSVPSAYAEMVVARDEFDENNDCSVQCVAHLCDIPYAVAHAAFAKYGRKPRDGVYDKVIRSVILSLGFRIREWSASERIQMIYSYPGVHRGLSTITTHHPRRFAKAWSKVAHKRLALFTRGHVAAFKDGEVTDWTINKSYAVLEIWEVSKIDQ
jgi:hypothetical protein